MLYSKCRKHVTGFELIRRHLSVQVSWLTYLLSVINNFRQHFQQNPPPFCCTQCKKYLCWVKLSYHRTQITLCLLPVRRRASEIF